MALSVRLFAFLFLAVEMLAATSTFTPMSTNGDDGETLTGLWFRPDLGTAADVVPLKTRLWATRESVTGGVALKAWFGAGSTGRLARVYDPLPANSAGITFFAKASRPITVIVNNAERSVGTNWTKVDYSWDSLGTSSSSPAIGYQFIVTVKGPIATDTWLIIDRVGVESPIFDPAPAVSVQTGPDVAFETASMLSGSGNLAATLTRAVAQQPFQIIAFGDSVTAGAQANRSTWAVTDPDIPKFLYFSQLARLWANTFGDSAITTRQYGHGGWTAAQGLTVVDTEVVANASAADLVILEFGANDFMAGRTPDQWKIDLKNLIAHVKTKTNQIVVMSPTVGPGFPGDPVAISAVLDQLVAEDGVATVDVTKFMLYRGFPFASALLSNPYHPDFMGHITLAEMMAPLLTLHFPSYPPDSPAGTPVDTVAPVLSSIVASGVTGNSATVSWTTDEAADGQVEYGTTTAYGQLSTASSTLSTSHAITFNGLSGGTSYHYRVRSRDAVGNLAISNDSTFTTAASFAMYLEAEAGSLISPMKSSPDAAASGGAYISTSRAQKGEADYVLVIPALGDYYIWGRVKAASTAADAFGVAFDRGTADVYDSEQAGWKAGWQWTKVNGRSGGPAGAVPVRVFHLAAGTHTLKIAGDDVGPMLDRLFVTDSPAAVPR